MLELKNVSFAYAGNTETLSDINLQVQSGEQVGLIGPNGAGKSTLMKAILGLIQAQGSISMEGICLDAKHLGEIRHKIGYVFQDSDHQMFMPKVYDDMMFGLLNAGMDRSKAEEKVDSVLSRLEIAYLKNRPNHKMSGGEKRMAAIATILAMDPQMMLLDEPSASLDPKNRRKLIQTLNQLPVGKIIASHDLDMILETCDRVVLLYQGKIVADGPAREILQNRELLEKYDLELPYCMAGIPERAK